MGIAYSYLARVTHFIARAEARRWQARQQIRAISFEVLFTVATCKRILIAQFMIDFYLVIVNSLLIGPLREEVVISLIRIENIYRRLRKEIEQLLRNRAD